MRLLFALAVESRWTLIVAMLASVIGGLASAGLVALINRALGASQASLTELGWQFLVLGIVVLVMRTMSQSLFMRLGQAAKAGLRLRTIDRIGRASYPHLEKQGAARSLAILTQDLDTIVVCFLSLPNLTMQGAVVFGCLVYLGFLSWKILIFSLVTVAIGSIGFHLANIRARAHLASSRRREDELVRHFQALFDGAKELKLHRGRKRAFERDVLATNIEAVRSERTLGYVLYAAAASWGSFIFFTFIGCVLFVFSRLFPIEGHVMSGYAMLFLYMMLPIEGLLAAIPTVSSARVALERIEQVNGALPIEETSETQTAATYESIVLDGVTHCYFREKENDVFTLGPISLTFNPGEVVYVIGGNGSGKTTLAKLLVGLYTPEQGRILLNGHTVRKADRDQYRQNFSVVFSDFFLFDSLFGLHVEKLDAYAQDLLKQLQLDHKVKINDGVFSTLNLSQGQRKRLALLVAYLEDRPFYLFDEWAADQDPLFKDVFYRRLVPELKARGKTVVVITHDDRYFAIADRCIKLEYGQIVSTGGAAHFDSGGSLRALETLG
ncbi:cyclic peptide export ABC transporter [Paraburkholderia tropica]|uniref:cyclic peptide export ABC transporter n=1 Tax=Paraburkholderia tropica TaxID=92647 RepID=UPI0007ED47D9|nr:cyclic peptide export ABC transporter [Paraburkholderia tropica]OBR50055.1 cyclic peptide transporter [Paraburkholderia tropica]